MQDKKIKFKVPYFDSFLTYKGTVLKENRLYLKVKYIAVDYNTFEQKELTTEIPKSWVVED
jgi:hypothetical protein